MYYRDQIEKIMSEAGFSDSERELFGEVVDIYILNGKGELALGDERLKVLLSKIEKLGLYEELKKKGVLVRFWGKEKIEDFLRITIGTPEQMEVLFAKAAEILQEQKGD
nr:hypothetical protein [Prevotella sp.]